MAEGLTPSEARTRALEEFGDVAGSSARLFKQDRELERSRTLGRFVSELRQDTAYAVRLIARNKAFSFAAVLTLGVAIGGNTAIFSMVNALFFQPLVLRAPHELVRIYTGESTVSWLNVDDIRRRNAVFSDVVAQGQAIVSLAAEPLPLVIPAGLVSMNYFSVLGTPPLMGRTPQPDDTRADVVVLSERLWRSRFGASESIIGRTITVDGRSRDRRHAGDVSRDRAARILPSCMDTDRRERRPARLGRRPWRDAVRGVRTACSRGLD